MSITNRISAIPPDHVAVCDGPQRLSYGELNHRAQAVAHRLRQLGVGRETPVVVLMERSADFVVAALAVWKAGGAYVPVDPAYPAQRIAYIIENSGAPVVLTHRGLPVPATAATIVDIAESTAPPVELGSAPDPASLAYIIYTSGSTGLPKGVEITHANLESMVDWHLAHFGVDRWTRASQLAGLGFDAAVWEIWPYIAAGASLHIVNDETRNSPYRLRDWMVEERITIAFAPTLLAEQLVALDWPATSSLRALLTGADTLRRRPAPGLPFRFYNNYGPTECTVLATCGIIDPGEGVPSIGRPISSAQVYILDENGAAVSGDAEGEIYIAGPGVGRGYRGLPDLTAARFLPNPFGEGAIYRTGDRARYLASGEIAFLGRVDHQIKLRGFRIEPEEIVAALVDAPGIDNAAVAAFDDASGERMLAAYVVAASPIDEPRLRAHVAQRLPEYMVPARFLQLAQLPVTANGKLDRRALPDPNAAASQAAVDAPGADIESRLAAIATALLEVPSIGRDDNFFLLGGHSLLAAQLLVKINQTFGVKLTLRQLFQLPTVAGLAGEIAKLKGAAK